MPNEINAKENKEESLFLNERLMSVLTGFIAATGLVSLVFFRDGLDSFVFFALLAKLVTSIAMYFTFRSYNPELCKRRQSEKSDSEPHFYPL